MPIHSKLLQRLINKTGSTVTFRTKAILGEDSHGDDTYTTTNTEITAVRSLVTNTRVPFLRQSEIGVARIMQVEFFTRDTISIPEMALGEQAVIVDSDGLEYEVMQIEDSQVGVIRFICQTRRV